MAETGIVRFPAGSLDPRAEEFRPQNPNQAVILFRPPPPPPPLPTPVFYPFVAPAAAVGELQVVPLGYEQFPAAAAAAACVSAASGAATRAVALSSVGAEASETSVRRELEVFGEVRAVQMDRLRAEGVVTVHFYDLRHAQAALSEIRHQHMLHQSRLRNHFLSPPPPFAIVPAPPPSPGLVSGRAVWAQFVVPAANAVPEGHNQGTLVLFNLDSHVSVSTLRDIFQPFGAIKEFRETPAKRQQKFVEFFDVRDAARALKEMNGKDIHGKPLVIEFSRPGGHSRKYFLNTASFSSPNGGNNTSIVVPTISPRAANNSYANAPVVRSAATSFHNKFFSAPPNLPPRKLSGARSSATASFGFGHYGNNASPRTQLATAKKNAAYNKSSSSLSLSNATSGAATASLSKKNGSPTTSNQAPVAKQAPARANGGGARHKNKWKQGKKLDSRFLINEDTMSTTAATATATESSGTCRDNRTTVMIKNIPNKYSQKLLLNMLDNHCIHCNKRIADGGEDQPFSSYDFVYLPIDFNNKCNVGYGFVNMTSPEATWRLYKAFHLQLWEAFNSRKICEVTYARVQGLEALKEHFKNSKFPCEMEHYLPVVFSPPRDGRQLTEPLPIVGQPAAAAKNLPAVTTPSSSSSDRHDRDENSDGGDDGSANNDEEKEEQCHKLCQNGGVVISDSNDDEQVEDRD